MIRLGLVLFALQLGCVRVVVSQDPQDVCPPQATACMDNQVCAGLIANGQPDATQCAANAECQALKTCMEAADTAGGDDGGGPPESGESEVVVEGTAGACGTTDREVADLCYVPNGVCHSFCVSSDPSSTSCDYRGSYVGPLVSFHDQMTAVDEAGGDVSQTKIYRFAPPSFVGFPDNCDVPEFYEAVDASGSEFLAAGRKHVSFELHETLCSINATVAESVPEGTFKCESPMVPPTLLSENSPEADWPGKSVMTGKSFGVDQYSVRDQVSYRTDTQTDQTLMYQLFLRPATVDKINFGDRFAPPRVCIQAGCEGKTVSAGQFKFTVGTQIQQAILAADTVRLSFKLALENGVAADGDTLDTTLAEQGRLVFSSPSPSPTATEPIDFTVDFARNFLYGAYDSGTAAFDGSGIGVGLASVSVVQTDLSAVVHVDLALNDDLKAACEGVTCMLLYDPDLVIGDAGEPPAQADAQAGDPAGQKTSGGRDPPIVTLGAAAASMLMLAVL